MVNRQVLRRPRRAKPVFYEIVTEENRAESQNPAGFHFLHGRLEGIDW